MALGGGGRFAALAAKIGPAAAAAAGRAKYGAKGMAALSHHGTAGAPVARAYEKAHSPGHKMAQARYGGK